MNTKRARQQIESFLKLNGWEQADECEDLVSYCKHRNIGVDIEDELVVLIDDQGDFAEHKLTGECLYWLIGRLVSCRALSMGFRLP